MAPRLPDIKKRLDEISPSFCLAKWQQVTLHLQNGNTHSCHHPPTHRVPLDELADRPDALHNTQKKMLARKEMLQGKRPAECEYCWKAEDLSLISDRIRKSACDWALPEIDRIRELPWNSPVIPSYVEVSFSNTCNFKCAYCSPHISSKWMEEIRELGDYPMAHPSSLKLLSSMGRLPIPEHEANPYVQAFWKWWPELYPRLKVLRITGGEPLLSRHTFKVLEHVRNHPRSDLELAINTNLGVPANLIEELIRNVTAMRPGETIRSFTLFTSVDTWGEQAEYIRYGMKFDQFWKNVRTVLSRLPEIRLSFMCTFNLLSPFGLARLLAGINALKEEYGSRVMVDFPLLNHPDFLSAQLLPESFSDLLDPAVRFVEDRIEAGGFSESELLGLNRAAAWMRADRDPGWLSKFRADFFRFITEYDKRRGLKFEKTFPELGDFLEICKNEHIQETLARG